ncbi:hypothetical protein BCF44_1307 [Kutzneria buriramensis]|uniref:Uncharacterized protein n=1 Tax=Kutzneria buriramensis TaxID=1045776 RepID=A0A3E0GTT6_9PSEU|nr:hypothetical protein [Kutzneria buriramensis]REH27036.1 hypothetical protein BCF44_1307 [Kutzneria buriramensis]
MGCPSTYGLVVTTPEPVSLDQLIDDCADIPGALRQLVRPLPSPRQAAPWRVDETCVAQVSGLDDY